MVIDAIKASEHDLRLAIDGRSRLHVEYKSFLEHLGDSHTLLVQRYRNQVLTLLQTQRPARFAAPPLTLPFLTPPPLPDLPDLNHTGRNALIERMEHFIGALNRQFEAQVQKYDTILVLTTRGDSINVAA